MYYIYDRVASCVAAAINGIWSYNGIPVLYNLTCLLCLKIIRAEGRGEKEGKKQDGKEAKNEFNGEKTRGKKTNKRKRDRMKKQ